jgi:hypothetical protein
VNDEEIRTAEEEADGMASWSDLRGTRDNDEKAPSPWRPTDEADADTDEEAGSNA